MNFSTWCCIDDVCKHVPALHYSFRIDSCISTHQFILPQIFHQPLVFFQHLQQYRRLKIWLGKMSGSTLWHGFLFCKRCCSKEITFFAKVALKKPTFFPKVAVPRKSLFLQRMLFQGNHLFCKGSPALFFQRLYHSTSQQLSQTAAEGSFQSQYWHGVSLHGGTPKSSILIGFSLINHPFWGRFMETSKSIWNQYQINMKSIFFWPKKSIFWWFQKINIQINIFFNKCYWIRYWLFQYFQTNQYQ